MNDFKAIYDRMRKGIFAHECYVNEDSFHLLEGMDFVFLCMEGKGKRQVVSKLEQADIPFVDVGMGIYLLGGLLGARCARPPAPPPSALMCTIGTALASRQAMTATSTAGTSRSLNSTP